MDEPEEVSFYLKNILTDKWKYLASFYYWIMHYILQERNINGHNEYLVKWSYKTHAHNTWLLEDEIIELGQEEILKHYFENY